MVVDRRRGLDQNGMKLNDLVMEDCAFHDRYCNLNFDFLRTG